MVVMLAGLSVIVFITIELPPGDFADRRALDLRSQGISVTQEDVTAMRHQMGLDRPWFQRYVTWITNIVFHGNFGQSFGQHRPVSEVLGERVGLTIMLAIATIIFTYGLAIPIGIYSAIRQYSLGDYAATIVGYFGMATPSFMLALILLYFSVMVFNNSVGGLFSSQYAEAPWSWAKFVDLLRHLHRAELGGEGGAGAAGHDDAGHHRAHLAHDGDADQIGDVDGGPELLQLHGADEGHDDADQKADERDDRQRVGADLLHVEPQVVHAEARPAAHQGAEGERQLAQEAQELRRLVARRQRDQTDARQ